MGKKRAASVWKAEKERWSSYSCQLEPGLLNPAGEWLATPLYFWVSASMWFNCDDSLNSWPPSDPMALSYGGIFFLEWRSLPCDDDKVICGDLDLLGRLQAWMGSQQSLGFKSCFSLEKVLHFFFQILKMLGVILYPVYPTWGSPVKDTGRGGKSLPHCFTDRQGAWLAQHSISFLEVGPSN